MSLFFYAKSSDIFLKSAILYHFAVEMLCFLKCLLQKQHKNSDIFSKSQKRYSIEKLKLLDGYGMQYNQSIKTKF